MREALPSDEAVAAAAVVARIITTARVGVADTGLNIAPSVFSFVSPTKPLNGVGFLIEKSEACSGLTGGLTLEFNRSFSKPVPRQWYPRCEEPDRADDKGDTQRDVRPVRLALHAVQQGDDTGDHQANNEPGTENLPPPLVHDTTHSPTEATWHERGSAIPIGE